MERIEIEFRCFAGDLETPTGTEYGYKSAYRVHQAIKPSKSPFKSSSFTRHQTKQVPPIPSLYSSYLGSPATLPT